MKQIILLFGLCIAFTGTTYAQLDEDEPELDTVLVDSLENIFYEDLTDSVFALMSFDSLKTNYFIDKAMLTADPLLHKGLLHDSNWVNHFEWKMLYGSLLRAAMDTTQNPDPLDTIGAHIESYLAQGKIPLLYMAMHYDRIKDSAFADSLLELDGMQLRDVPGREDDPFEQKILFAAAPGQVFADTNVVTFIMPSEFFITNSTKTILAIEADFDNGEGWVELTPDVQQLVSYDTDTPVTAEMRLRVRYTDNTELNSHSFFNINYSAAITQSGSPYNYLPLFTADKGFTVTEGGSSVTYYAQAKVHVQLACGNTRITKPLILLPAYEGQQAAYLGVKTTPGTFWISKMLEDHDELKNVIINEGYDIIYIEFTNRAHYIQANAYVTEKVIKWINAEKAAAGSTQKNVVWGWSMGGLVGRYALVDMEDDFYNHNPSSDPTMHHNTRALITFDSPHHGANFPLGIQAYNHRVYATFSVLNAGSRHPISKYEKEFINTAYSIMNNGDTRQMLIYQYNSSNSLYQSFYTTLSAMNANGGFPVDCYVDALTNGSINADNQGYVSNARLIDFTTHASGLFVPFFSGVNLNLSKASIKVKNGGIWAVPDKNDGNKKIHDAVFVFHLPGGDRVKWSYQCSTQYTLSVDNAPGGYLPIGGASSGFVIERNWYCIVPTVSALGIKGANALNPFFNISSSNSSDRYVRDYEATNFDIYLNNDQHILFPIANEGIVIQNLDHVGSSTLPSTLSGTYNFGASGTDFTTDRLGSVTVTNGGVLSVNGDMAIGLHSNGNPSPAAGSVFSVYTRDNGCNESVNITIEDGGQFIIGDDNTPTNNKARVYVTGSLTYPSSLTLMDGSTLIVKDNSRLVIGANCLLNVNDGASIQLEGNNSVLEIQGTLKLDNSTTLALSYANGFEGYILFSKESSGATNPRIAANGSGAILTITGNNTSDKIMEVAAGSSVQTNAGSYAQLDELDIQTGVIEMGENAGINLYPKIDLQQLTFNGIGVSANYIHNGITLYTPDADNILIRHCDFNNAKTALRRPSGSFSHKLEVGDCIFTLCEKGIYTTGLNAKLKFVKFDQCSLGWKAESMSAACEFMGLCASNTIAIDFGGNSSASLLIYNSDFTLNGNAVRHQADNFLALACNSFISNNTDIEKEYGEVKLSGSSITMLDGTNTQTPGSNLFQYSSASSIGIDNADIQLTGGANSFIYSSLPSAKVFFGTTATSISTLAKGGNLWNISSATDLTASDIDIYGVSAVSGTALSSNTLSCAFWSGEHMDNTGYNMLPTREITSTGAPIDKQVVLIYPNPTDKLLHVKYNAQNTNYIIKAVDMTGRIIYLQPTTSNSQTRSFDVSNLATGLYQILIEQNGIILVKQKVVVRR
ncbi:MAG: T9SS type A sorting domain-containing protein [Bacteroidia bacterium]|nr:T9SS type A sorting domain-containing protein [Bacteroidia bacterium]